MVDEPTRPGVLRPVRAELRFRSEHGLKLRYQFELESEPGIFLPRALFTDAASKPPDRATAIIGRLEQANGPLRLLPGLGAFEFFERRGDSRIYHVRHDGQLYDPHFPSQLIERLGNPSRIFVAVA